MENIHRFKSNQGTFKSTSLACITTQCSDIPGHNLKRGGLLEKQHEHVNPPKVLDTLSLPLCHGLAVPLGRELGQTLIEFDSSNYTQGWRLEAR